MYLYVRIRVIVMMVMLLAWRQEAKRLAEEVNQLHLNTTGPKRGELLALFGALFLFRGTSGLYWTLHKYPEEPAMPRRETILQGSEGIRGSSMKTA